MEILPPLLSVVATALCIVTARIYAHYCVDDYASMRPSRHGCYVRAFIGLVLVVGVVVTCLLLVVGIGRM